MAVELSRRRFTVDEFFEMARVGILHEDDRVELIDGEIVEVAPIGPEHAGKVNRLNALFMRRFGDCITIAVQNPLVADRFAAPEPDLALLQPRTDYYELAHPTPSDVLLVVEVADTTIATDRAIKMPLYARTGVQEAWLLDLRQGALLVYRHPGPEGYQDVAVLKRGSTVAPLAFPGEEIAVADLLG
jgi:Uma2 family endonuclease